MLEDVKIVVGSPKYEGLSVRTTLNKLERAQGHPNIPTLTRVQDSKHSELCSDAIEEHKPQWLQALLL